MICAFAEARRALTDLKALARDAEGDDLRWSVARTMAGAP